MTRVFGRRRAAVSLVLVVFVVGAIASAGRASRPASPIERRAVEDEVLASLADSPDGGFGHGTRIVLQPICISTVDRRYVRAVVTPIRGSRVDGNPADVFLHVVPGGYRVLSIRTGDLYWKRPNEVPSRTWSDLDRRRCDPGSAEQLHKCSWRTGCASS